MAKYSLFFCLVLPALLIMGCTGYAVLEGKKEPEPQIPRETGPEPAIYFCKKDNCSRGLEEAIALAHSTAHCAFYDLDLANIIGALSKKSKEIEVRVVLDDESYEGALSGPGVVVEDRPSRMHNKFCVLDASYVFTGSFNPTSNDNDINDNNAILLSSVYLSGNYEQEFSELWEGKFSAGERVLHPLFQHNDMLVESYFCPEDECEERISHLISKANSSIHFMVFSFTSKTIADAILYNANAKTMGVFDSSQAGSKYSQYHRLSGFGVFVKKDKGKGKLHHKVFIIDNETVITGSYNPTGSGSNNNDENILVVHDKTIARMYLDEFNRLFDAS